MPFAYGEAPNRRYLVGVAKGGSGALQLHTCPISIVFTNITDGDVVLLDDVAAQFNECSVPTKTVPLGSRNIPKAHIQL
ncbi:hypothetical protein KIN20_021961 [Parelaphostrongylus tenuis]|uniref:Uncharacterized protein n=1 Tax=Parelaphostrongylus tenuis TaxID=148309 RepID=A0AAD5N5R1_PARTN|nr:hypothetical protein KIN20_021961 [Parelaphostrongylus tenuis]